MIHRDLSVVFNFEPVLLGARLVFACPPEIVWERSIIQILPNSNLWKVKWYRELWLAFRGPDLIQSDLTRYLESPLQREECPTS